MDNRSIKKLESDLWESADLLRAGSKLTSNQYCMPVLGLLFLRYAYSRFKMVEEEILKTSDLLGELLRIFNNNALDEVGGDVIGRIYEYFLNKFAKNIASDDGVFFTPKSLVKMIVNVLEPRQGVLLENCTTSLIRVAAA